MTNVYVLGLEPFNLSLLEDLPQAEDCRFLELLSADQSVEVPPGFRLEDLRQQALERVHRNGRADAILNYWDFPGVCLAPLLSRDLDLPGPSLESVAVCEHKYWARKAMEACVPDMTPRFCAVNPFDSNAARAIDLPFPFWLKPFVSHSSYLGFKISNLEDLNYALAVLRQQIGHFGDPFNEFLDHVDKPEGLEDIGGCHCIAEEIISSDHQVTLEGYSWQGQVTIYGAIDSIREGYAQSSFARYDYPSHLPAPVIKRMKQALTRLVKHIGLDNTAFNAEFFWDQATDRINLLEINSRISKSHSPLFHLVDGQSNQGIAVDLALGREPRFRNGRGDWPRASKFMVRLFQDGEIRQIPHTAQINYLKSRYPEAMVQILVNEGQRLSHLAFQDSYSFEIADLFFGGRDQLELLDKYSNALEILPFEVHLTAPMKAAQ